MLLLALEDVQSLLAAPDLSAELLFVLALVLSLCSARWPGDDGVVCVSPLPTWQLRLAILFFNHATP